MACGAIVEGRSYQLCLMQNYLMQAYEQGIQEALEGKHGTLEQWKAAASAPRLPLEPGSALSTDQRSVAASATRNSGRTT